MTKRIMTRTEFAADRSVSRQMVGRYVKAGLPVLPDGRIEAKTGRAWVKNNILLRTEGDGAETFSDARTRKESTLADLRRLEFEVKEGKLVDLDAVEAEWIRVGIEIRDAVMALPGRIVNRIPAESRREVLAVAQDEARQILMALSNKIRSGPRKPPRGEAK